MCAQRHPPYLSTSTVGASAVDGQLIYKGLQLFIVPHVFVAAIVPKEESTRSLKSFLLYRIIVTDISQDYPGYRSGLKTRRICSGTSR